MPLLSCSSGPSSPMFRVSYYFAVALLDPTSGRWAPAPAPPPPQTAPPTAASESAPELGVPGPASPARAAAAAAGLAPKTRADTDRR